MKPSETTSLQASFTLPQPSPVHAIIKTFRKKPPTTFNIDPDHLFAPPHTPVASTSQRQLTPITVPSTSSRQCRDEWENLDFIPSKRMQLMAGNLTQMSASYLASKTPITSSDLPFNPVFKAPPPLPEPNWSLIHAPTEGHQTRAQMATKITELMQSLQHAEQHLKA
ncbi:hypothetical protein CC2G_011652 [Coprinopsis cinerea AmutBmut pab1-1]|nr:hypothetical protein CC2G_011652 [Coprinopsis cinerea AmutBmut pab1-1]